MRPPDAAALEALDARANHAGFDSIAAYVLALEYELGELRSRPVDPLVARVDALEADIRRREER